MAKGLFAIIALLYSSYVIIIGFLTNKLIHILDLDFMGEFWPLMRFN
jgi:hypothetical protein